MIVLVPDGFSERVLPHLELREPGRVIQTSLGDEFEAQLQAALEAARRTP